MDDSEITEMSHMSDEDRKIWCEHRLDQISRGEGSKSIDQSSDIKFNPSHDPETGQFSEEGGGGGSSASPLSARAIRAKQTHKTSTAAVQRQAESNEPKVAAAIIGGKQTGDNDVFDVLSKGNGVEVKTIVRGKNDKITTHPPSLARKVAYAEENNIQSHTVAFDDRNNKIYYKKGVGSFRLSSMKEIDLGDLREIIK